MKLNRYKKEILEFIIKFPVKGEKESYEISQKDFDKKFKNNKIYQENLDVLLYHGVIFRYTKNNQQFLRLEAGTRKIEVRKILTFERLEKTALAMQPLIKETKDLSPRFYEHADQHKKNGVYYFYTQKGNPENWYIIAKLNSKSDSYRYLLGSMNDKNSKLYGMWVATVKAWKQNRKQPFRRGEAEKLDQDSFGNNRQRGFGAYKLFLHAGWLRIHHETGISPYYVVVDENAHKNPKKLNKFFNNVLNSIGDFGTIN